MALPGIGTLWIGEKVSWLEQLCLKSFLDNGHQVTVFSYDPVGGLPEGVITADADDILPADKILRHARTGSPAYHADIFRLQMLKQTDLVWADTDAYCCQPWKIPRGKHFHGWISDKVPQVNNGVLRLPKTSKTLAEMIKFASDEYPIPPWFSEKEQAELQARKDAGEGVHVSLLPWGVLGPDALSWFLTATGEIEHSQPGHVIYPVPFKTAGMTLNPNRADQTRDLIRDDTLSIHFWGRRFRNVAAKYGGIPEPGCFVAGLLEKHGIDPLPTAHMMKRVAPSKSKLRAELPDVIDFSMFTDDHVARIALHNPEPADTRDEARAWAAGDAAPLQEVAAKRRDNILTRVLEATRERCETFLDATDPLAPKRVAEIGCGFGFAALVLYHRYACDLVLIDVEKSDARPGGYAEETTGYGDLAVARAFLQANGVPGDRITTINPDKAGLTQAGRVDLALSQFSCGFHYPVETYNGFFRDQVSELGALVLDIRKGSGGVQALKAFGPLEIVSRDPKFATVLVRKELVEA